MGLQLSDREVLYHRKQMYENTLVHGIPATIESIVDKYEDSHDFYNDINDNHQSFDDKIDTYINLDEFPSISTLRSLGWYIENDDNPIIADIPVMYINREGVVATFKPSVDDKVSFLANPIDKGTEKREFLMKDFKGHGFPNVIWYTVKLVPYRTKKGD